MAQQRKRVGGAAGGGSESKTVRIGDLPAGSLTKEVERPGAEGTAPPKTGARVTVHYTGYYPDGTVFDSSRKRGTPFSFNLGAGEVIMGWDQGVATMNKGEVAVLKCSPEYAYGGDKEMWFHVEMLDWKEGWSSGGGVSPLALLLLVVLLAFGGWLTLRAQ